MTSDDLCASLTALCLDLLVFCEKSPHIGLYERLDIIAGYTDEYLTLREQVGRVLRNEKAPDPP